jgi:hypothetical protein
MPSGTIRAGPFSLVCLICGQTFESPSPRAKYCKRAECQREVVRRRDADRYALHRTEILATAAAGRARFRGYTLRWREKRGFRCIDCGKVISEDATRCKTCLGKSRTRERSVTVKCASCGTDMERLSRQAKPHIFCSECLGMLVRAAGVLGLTKQAVDLAVKKAQLALGRDPTRRQALEYVLIRRGVPAGAVFKPR